MAIELKNGVSLPDIPEGVLDTYPYVMILHSPGDGSYVLLGTDGIFLCGVADSFGSDYDFIANWGPDVVGYNHLDGAWQIDTSITYLELELDGTVEVVWSNHDIYYMTGFDSTYNPVLGDVYFEDNSFLYAEEYAVETSIIRGIARQIRRLVGVDNKLVVSAMESLLKGVEAATEANWIGAASYSNLNSGGRLTSDARTIFIPEGFAFSDDVKLAVFPNALSITGRGFEGCTTLEKVEAPLLNHIGSGAFHDCTSLSDINGNVLNIDEIPDSAFFHCDSLVKIDFTRASSIGYLSFGNCDKLEAVILRKTDSICTLSDKYAFSGGSTKKYVYVPSALLSQYGSAENWSNVYQAELRAIEDYPDICGTT